jgi:hypothetical protein
LAWTRGAITAAAITAFLVVQRLPLPFVNAAHVLGWPSRKLGLAPLLAGYVFVEIVAEVVPSLRPLRRGGHQERGRLSRWAWGAGLAVAISQASERVWFLGYWRDLHGRPVLEGGVCSRIAIAATLVAATALMGWLALQITSRGLGNGFAVLMGVDAVQRLAQEISDATSSPAHWTDRSLVALLALAAMAPIVAAAMRRRWREGAVRIPVPTCGLIAILAPPWLLAFPARAAQFLPWLTSAAAALTPGRDAYTWVRTGLTIPIALILSYWFCDARTLVAAYSHAATSSSDEIARGVPSAVRRAMFVSLLLVVGLAVLPSVLSHAGAAVWIGVEDLFDVSVVFAVAADLVAEVRARSVGPLVSAWPLASACMVGPALLALDAAGIDAHPRSVTFRTFLQVFGPFAPEEVLVPAGRETEAAALCARVVSLEPAAAMGAPGNLIR